MLRIRNQAGGDSPYTIERAHADALPEVRGERVYMIEKHGTKQRTLWYVVGHRAVVSYATTTKPLPKYVRQAAEAEWAKDQLRDDVPEGSTVFTVLRHVSASGMSRRIDLYAIHDSEPYYLTGLAAIVFGETPPDHGMRVNGGGMDMGFHLVERLAWQLYGDGYALKHRWL